MGVPGCDIVDGLSLFYLLGKKDIEICGVTTTYGNCKIDTVYKNTKVMLAEIDRRDIPVLKGCANRYSLESDATNYLVEMVNIYPGEISILATGALTNLYAAYVKDHDFFNKISHLVIMGGITRELILNDKVFDEWNFTMDPSATYWVLREGKNLSVITRNMAVDVFISISDFINRLATHRSPIGRYMIDRCITWLEYNMLHLKSNGFYLWDLLAAAYLVNPQLFKDQQEVVSLNTRNINKGLLNKACGTQEGRKMNLPVLREVGPFMDDIYDAWLGVDYRLKQQLGGGL